MLLFDYLLAISATFVFIVGLIVRWRSEGDELRPSRLDIWYHGLLATVFWTLIFLPTDGALVRGSIIAIAVAAFALKGIEIARTRRDKALAGVSKKS